MTSGVVWNAFENSQVGPRLRPGVFRHPSLPHAIAVLAIAAPIFAFLAFVIAQTALTFLAERVMDSALAATARQIETASGNAKGLTPAGIRSGFCSRLAIFMSCSNERLHLDIRSYGSIAEIDPGRLPKKDEADNGETHFDPGGPDDFVVIRASYRWSGQPIYRRLFARQSPAPASYLSAFAVFKKNG